MKRIEVTVPGKAEDDVLEILEEYDEEISIIEVERSGEKYVRCELVHDSEDIDSMVEDLKAIGDLEEGELVIEVMDQAAHIEKGKRMEGGDVSISVNEMYSKAFEFSSFNWTSWALIALASAIAVFGVLMENVIVVIGAMVIAPMLGPFMANSFGLVIGDRRIIQHSTVYGILSIFLAVVVAMVISSPLEVEPNSLLLLIAEPGFGTIPLSLFVGAASALAFSTEARETLAGVAVAIALVPPAAVAGLALSMGNFSIFFNVSLVILSNVTSLILAGSVTFKLLGISPSTYYRKKVSEEELRKAWIISATALLLVASVVGYFSYQDLQDRQVRQQIDSELNERFGDRVLEKSVTVEDGRVTVELTVIDPGIEEDQLELDLEESTGKDVEVQMLSVSSSG